MSNTDKLREDRLRRMAKRQLLTLKKSHQRDPFAVGYGGYKLRDRGERTVFGGPLYEANLDQIEAYLTSKDRAFAA
jgi:hypothetical protein